LAERFITEAERRGIRVHLAGSAEEAVAAIAEIARSHGAQRIVKSKSMATEEMEINRHLQAAGMQVLETDLGEYIVQLAGQRPSHIVAPCLHLNRGQIADLFSREAGRRIATDTPSLTAFARERLREEFRQADLGISGGNFLVANEGAIVLVTNEGNGRMCTTLPRVHVALVGVEKLVRDFSDMSDALRILTVEATGQMITSYVSIIRGPALEGEEGPREVHVVLLDAGRSEILGGPQEEVLACIRCGACLDICPVYRQTGGHAYGSVYSGPIGAVLTPLLRQDAEAQALPFLSSLCGACSDICPVGIHLHEHLVALRARAVARGIAFPGEARAFRALRRAWTPPRRYRLVRGLVRGALRLAGGLPQLKAWRQGRSLPDVASVPVAERLRAEGLLEEGRSGAD
jgi:L-lactate dehydrogenase complex protein LldF